MSETIYGSKGIRFKHARVREQLNDLVQPQFHTLWQEEKLVAVAAYCYRKVVGPHRKYDAYYIRYFAVASTHQGQGIGKKLTHCLEEHYRSTIQHPTVFYAYIEPKNLPSLGVSKTFQQEQLGQFRTAIISRLFPHTHPLFEPISAKEHLNLLHQEGYSSHSFFQAQKIGYQKGTFGIRKDDEILAAVQAHLVEWEIVDLPGLTGWLSKNLLHFAPIIGRFAPRNKFQFIAFEGLCYVPGAASYIRPLLHSCLAASNKHIGMIYLDKKDPLSSSLAQQKLGWMNKIQRPPTVAFLANFLCFDDQERLAFHESIKYISAFDLT